nr:uncharacterized protein LOC128689811 [Cherax quadricarinatus]
MGSPLSAVLANLYMEHLEAERFSTIIPSSVTWLRYDDDILLITPKRFNVQALQDKLNQVEPSIQFTLEEEVDNTLPFLDVLLCKADHELRFKVYRKPTNQNDLLHFYSHHDTKTKRGVIIGFFLRALRICSNEFLEEECTIIEQVFFKLHYPRHFIRDCRRRALNIFNTPREDTAEKRYIVLPTNSIAKHVSNIFSNTSFQVSTSTTTTIKDITSDRQDKLPPSAGAYISPCNDCNKLYAGETSRDLQTRISEHQYASRSDDTRNACVQHRNSHNHLINYRNSRLIATEDNTQYRRILESSLISISENFNQNSGFYNIAEPLAKKLLHRYPT